MVWPEVFGLVSRTCDRPPLQPISYTVSLLSLPSGNR